MDGLIVKPEGKPVLVQEKDNRPELDTTAKMREEFSDNDYACAQEMREYKEAHDHDLGGLAFWKARLKDKFDTVTIETNYESVKGE